MEWFKDKDSSKNVESEYEEIVRKSPETVG